MRSLGLIAQPRLFEGTAQVTVAAVAFMTQPNFSYRHHHGQLAGTPIYRSETCCDQGPAAVTPIPLKMSVAIGLHIKQAASAAGKGVLRTAAQPTAMIAWRPWVCMSCQGAGHQLPSMQLGCDPGADTVARASPSNCC